MDIYLYLKSKNNDDSVKWCVKRFVKFAIHLFKPMHTCQIPHVIFKSTSQFLQILHQSSVPLDITPLLFWLKHFILWSEEPIKEQFFQIFECLSQNSLNSSCVFWNDKSIPLRILHYCSWPWCITPLYIFKATLFLLWTKVSHQSPNFDKVLRWKFAKFLESFFKPQVSFSSKFA